MSSKINFEFVSPESSLFSGEVVSVLLPAKEGDAEILPLHAPFMTALRVGIVEIKISESENMKFLIDGGFADVANDNVTLLAEKSFNLLESSKEDFLIELDKVNKSLEETEDLIERESLLAKKLILESNN
ncbi:MAG: ATP synthase F1 subunit epsilon [Pseudomonadota bacterium]|nr:ATP synthase F1 subunit epsilon [Pseudomonadota bacterium]MEC9392731.1 ATP synthase F1 subunit epsilon [Pseudomonadota bacterium]